MGGSSVWYASRAAGLVSYALLWASVVWGILVSSRPFSPKVSKVGILDWHRILSTAALTFGALHAGVLLLDKHAGFTVADLVVPFSSTEHPLATAMGVVALELGIAIAVSFRFRKRFGTRLWRGLHMFSYPVFAFALAHFIAIGTDAKNPLVLAAAIASGLSVVFATAFRVIYRAGGDQRTRTATLAANDAG